MADKKFSYFPVGHYNNKGIPVPTNKPIGELDIQSAHDYIVSEKAKYSTDLLRQITDEQERRAYKVLHFEYITAAGRFSYRDSKGLIDESGYMIGDVDKLGSQEEVLRVRDIFINDKCVESALVFTSPSGLGVKPVFVLNDAWGKTFKEKFQWLTRYFIFEYGIVLDQSGSDITRPCFMPYDPTCYINPKYTK